MAYGYNISSKDLGGFHMEGAENFKDLKNMVKLAYDEQLQLNTTHIEELIEIITEDRLGLYKEVLKGSFDIKKGSEWQEDINNHQMIVKNIEVFEKVVPIFISMSKQYEVKDIREIFEYCRNKNGSFNFAAINRIRLLINLCYNDKNKRLDLPIKEFMEKVYEFSDLKKVKKIELTTFLQEFAKEYAKKESTSDILIPLSTLTMDTLYKTFEKIFNCLIKTSRPNKNGFIEMERVELLWKEREYYNSQNQSDKVFILAEFLDTTVECKEVEAMDKQLES